MYRKEYYREYYLKNKERIKEKHRIVCKETRKRVKIEVLTHYGDGKCSCVRCGFEDVRALSLDHINSDGNVERKENIVSKTGTGLYSWLKSNNYPEGYQTLCMNCQFIKRHENEEWFRYT
ncbi:MAG: hypothetical protein WC196_06300 [Bacilli bacterium]